MAKVNGTLSSLIQGVSQQPARSRLSGQVQDQENFSSDPVDDLIRRPPTEYIATLVDDASTYTFTYHDAGSIGKYVIAHKAGSIKMFTLDGTELTVTINSGGSYITAGDMTFLGLDDIIYAVDPTVAVAMTVGSPDYIEDGCIVFLLGGQYGRDYDVTLNWSDSTPTDYTETISYTTPDGSSASHITNIATVAIATQLETALNANANIAADFDITRESDVILIKKKVAADVTTYTTIVSDGDGGTNMFSVNNRVADVGDLPRFAPQGYIVKVAESAQTSKDDWYLEFSVDPEADGTVPAIGDGFGDNGIWLEATAPGEDYQLDATTLPHTLVQINANTFEFQTGMWADRAAGDNETNPLPSFVGNTINDISAFQGRFVVTSDVNAIMSRTNKHTSFFKQSATANAADDPIDMASSLGSFILRSIVPHNRDLIIFSDDAQFLVFGRNALTPDNSSLVLTSEFETDLGAKPVAAGRNIFFTHNYGSFTGVQEFFTAGSEDVNDARSITSHVLQYIKGTATQLVSTTNFTKLVVRSDDDLKTVYTYEYIWINEHKVQSAWHTWKFNDDVEYMFFDDSLLYIVTKIGTQYNLSTLDLDNADDTGVGYRAMLDNKLQRINVTTSFTVPYTITTVLDDYVVVQGTGCPNPGLTAPILSISGSTVTLKEDMGNGTVYFGARYLSRVIPTQPFVRDREGNKIDSGKLTVKKFVAHFANTGFLKALITDKYGYSAEVQYEGRVLGDPDNMLGNAAVGDGTFDIPFKKNVADATLEIQSNSHLPLSLLVLSWTGQWKNKGKQITGG